MLDFDNLVQAMGDLDEDTMIEMLEEVMEDGGSEAGKAMEACQKGMEVVGSLFEEGEYFVGRTEADSPEVDCEVLISNQLKVGEFYDIKITGYEGVDLFGRL